MKNMMITTLFLLAVAAACGSTVKFTEDNQTLIRTPGSLVTLTVESTEELTTLSVIATMDTGSDTFAGGTGKADAATYGWTADLSKNPVLSNGDQTIELELAYFPLVPTDSYPPLDGTVGYVAFTYNGGNVQISLSNGSQLTLDKNSQTVGAIASTVTVVPEPATVLVFGIGGLIMRSCLRNSSSNKRKD
ncbi:hypothetical protein SMSP2_00610 [Limihaloglobus sulfuriphilus]|uniref:Uncharacterized protein n=1 Tax=Limihaloglobus sulfuriphilus TaxID=1851148 RepID=A0A1Q2MC38_9BACT|nr:PEP-CTERM sorting domain-containing protein [Limihaloglobus sulfuriphilus]AQQ70266.1 hypothetical protein SMSP2_00610 [Limihaloglobus sulfuriphilus]